MNTPKEKGRKFVHRQYGVQGFYRYERFFKDKESFLELMDNIPFLNGGLFENLDILKPEENIEIRIDCFSDRRDNETRLKVPDKLFFGFDTAAISDYLGVGFRQVNITGLIDLLQQYDFTIDENTPYDQEVALDPELLGLVFENLLASYNPETETQARKESGSFYTPRVVVDFMVEESLVQHLAQHTDFFYDKLKLLFKNNDEQPFEGEAEKKLIVEKLSEVKILDPACGSGAFPMGALQKIVHVLGKIDQENSMWYQKQKKIAIAETQQAYEIGDHEERKLRLNNIEQAFEKGMNDPDYARKLFLIENCMYGVDIQPIAMQISKLRFFISLLVEQKLNPEMENFGIIALPNLETKFVAADSLLHLPGSQNQQLSLQDPELEKLEKELKQVRHELFSARTPKTKEKRRKRHKEIQKQIGDLLIASGFPAVMAEAITNWKAFNQNTKADWFDPEWMFGVSKFDIVTGNPPYIQLQKAFPGSDELKYADLYKNEGYETFDRTGDIYALFYEQGIDLLKPGGLLCYITSNKWMRARYGRSLRGFFAERNPLLLIDLGPGIFEAATVDTNIILIQNSNTEKSNLLGFSLENKEQISALPKEKLNKIGNLNVDSWIILSTEENLVKKKIEDNGVPLKKWNVNIYRGVLTGYNEAFIIDEKTKDSLINQDGSSKSIIKPIYRGRHIQRYISYFPKLWLINTHNGYFTENGKKVNPVSVEDYPPLKAYLNKFWDEIKKRKDQGKTPYNLRNCSYIEKFEKEKIVWAETIKIYFDGNRNFPRFHFLSNSEFLDKTCFMMTGDKLKYILSILNSKVSEFYIRRLVMTLGSGSLGLQKNYIESVPVPKNKEDYEPLLEKMVNDVIRKKSIGEDTKFEEQKIDLMVYKLYELTYDEVLVIDHEPPFSREEYESFQVEGKEVL